MNKPLPYNRRTRKLIFVLGLLVWGAGTYAQDTPEFPTIAPPTPTAASLHSYGNNSVNYYSGTVDVSIPLYTIQEGNITVPIVLNYTGGSGIKVEEQASWVGLGWALNAGGAVSRTKRGVADEAPSGRGFMSYTEIPTEQVGTNNTLVNADFFWDIARGRKDSQPDKFMYSTPSGSGSFFINYDESIYQKPFSEKRITFQKILSTYTDGNGFACNSTNGLDGFYVEDEMGLMYHFEEKERSNSRNQGGNVYDNSCYPTTWQMTKITDNNSDLSVDFEYDAFYYSNVRLTPVVSGPNETTSYVEDFYLSKRLKKITHSQGSVEFIVSTTERKDLEDNYPLETVRIKDIDGNTIKEYRFSYRYFTSNALVDDSPGLALSSQNRLVLTSVEEVGTDGSTLPPHTFTYNTTHYLPDTDSKSKDHWGYYNGKNNSKFQARQLANYWNGNDNEWQSKIIGDADREPSVAHAQAGMLRRVDYPTGGYTVYEYEGNTAVADELPAILSSQTATLSQPNTAYPLTVELYSSNAYTTEMRLRAIQYPTNNSIQCVPIIQLRNTATNEVTDHPFNPGQSGGGPGGGGPGILEEIIFVEPGSYEISFFIQQSNPVCNPTNFDYFFQALWDNESSSTTKSVGGVRIQRITDYAGSGVSHYRTFDYDGDNGETSGSILNVPTYWFQNYSYTFGTSTSIEPLSIVNRSAISQYPLVETAGNVVGYSKVTMTRHDGTEGKTEYYFTGPGDYPDKRMGYVQNNNQRDEFNWLGRPIKTLPVVPENTREYTRGKLLKQVDYKYNGSTYDTIAKLVNTYKVMAYDPDLPGQQFNGNKSYMLGGVNVANTQSGQTSGSVKEFEIHSGYMQLESSTTTQYNANGTVVTHNLNSYPEDDDGALTYMIPIEREVTDSWGDVTKTKEFYAFNALLNPDRDPAQDGLINDMVSRNMIYQRVQVSSQRKKGNSSFTDLGNTQTRFRQTSSGDILPHKIQTAKTTNSLEDRMEYVDYDGRKNPLEIKKTDGSSTCFVWGYDGTQVIAKIENASYATMTGGQNSAITAAVNASNGDINTATENTLRAELQDLRNAFPNAMVTTFTYDVPVGVTSITDPRGYTVFYEYDVFNRLQFTKDADGHLLTEQEYNYKN
ncbi:MAG: RHS repeat domain-containing protein [Bacteroidota bacterium]